MTTKQQNEIVKLYAEAIETEGNQRLWYEQLVTFRETFGDAIPDWRSRLVSYATKKGLPNVISAVEEYEQREMIRTSPPEPPVKAMYEIRKTQYGYSSKTDEETEAEIKAFHERQMRYVLMMAVLDQMYRNKKLTWRDTTVYRRFLAIITDFRKGVCFGGMVLIWLSPLRKSTDAIKPIPSVTRSIGISAERSHLRTKNKLVKLRYFPHITASCGNLLKTTHHPCFLFTLCYLDLSHFLWHSVSLQGGAIWETYLKSSGMGI